LTEKSALHLTLNQELIENARIALLPGDPGRVPIIAKQLNASKEIAHKREFYTCLGYLNDLPVLVTSTGIGGPSISICVEELAQLGVRYFIRVGTTGSIQEHVNIGDVVISTASVRLDGASKNYAPIEYPAVADIDLTNALIQSARDQRINFHVGITACTANFYQGQERYQTYSGHVAAHLRDSMSEWRAIRVANFEMESATLFTMCSTMGLRAGCACGVVSKRTLSEQQVSADIFRKSEQNSIDVAVGAVERIISSGLVENDQH